MQIHAPSMLLSSLGTAPAALREWLVGQVLTAEVIGAPTKNYTRIRIDNQLVDARTSVPMATGQKLTVRVAALNPTIVLRVVPSASAATADPVTRALARSVPLQSNLADTVTTLRTLLDPRVNVAAATATATPTAAAPPFAVAHTTLAGALQQLHTALPQVRDLDAAPRLRAVLENAATPLEKKLALEPVASNAPRARPTADDLRAQLSRIATHLARAVTAEHAATTPLQPAVVRVAGSGPARPGVTPGPIERAASGEAPPAASPTALETTIPRLRELVEQVVQRLYSHQLGNAQQSAGTTTNLVVEFPVMHEQRLDLWHFEFQHEEQAADRPESDARTVVTVRLQLAEHYSVNAELRASGDMLNVRLGSNHVDLHRLIGVRVAELETSMRERGLNLNAVAVGAVNLNRETSGALSGLIRENV